MESVFDNQAIKDLLISNLEYKYCDVCFRGFSLRGVYVLFNEKNNYLEFHSKEKDGFHKHKKFWHTTIIGILSLNEKFQSMDLKYGKKGVREITLDLHNGISLYPKSVDESEVIELFKELKQNQNA